jgi:hypothetical protein
MTKTTKHVIIPAILPAIFLVVASVPVELIGCRNRGLIAALVALAAGILGVAAAVKALMDRVRGDSHSSWWIASALILAIPAFLIVFNVF